MALSNEKAKEYLTRRISPKEKYEDLLKFPRYIEIETVNACNARCPMCTINDWDRRYSAMTDELFQKVAKEICEHTDEVKRVVLYRDGEPLLDKKLPEKVAILKKGGVKTTSISTNVALLSEKKAADLLESGIDHVILSIDSLVKDVYESIRVRCKFEEVMENAHRFIQLRNKIRPRTQVFIRMIRQKSNLNEWPEYQKVLEQICRSSGPRLLPQYFQLGRPVERL